MLSVMTQNLPVVDCVPQGALVLADDVANQVSATFKALSDPVRVKLLHHISANCCSSVCACHMPDSLGISQPTLSYHLGRLVKVGLISREMRHKWAHYNATPQGLEMIREFLGGLPDPSSCSVSQPIDKQRKVVQP